MRAWPTAAEAHWTVEAAAGERGPVAMLAERLLQAGGAPAQGACLVLVALGMGLLVAGGDALGGAGLWPRNAPGPTGGESRDAAARQAHRSAWFRGLAAAVSVVCIPAFVTDAQGAGPSLLAGCGVVAGALKWRVGGRCRAPAHGESWFKGSGAWVAARLASVTFLVLTAALAAPGGAVDAWLRGVDPASVLRGEILGVGARSWNEVGAAAPVPWPLGVLLVGALLARPRAGLAALGWACVGTVVAGHAATPLLLLALASDVEHAATDATPPSPST